LGIHGIGGWVAPRTSPDILGKWKVFCNQS
jgi:hypothetical protein